MKFDRDDYKFIGGLFGWFGLVAAALLSGVNFAEKYACDKYEFVTGRETKWVTLSACYVDSGDGWLTMDEYKAVIVAREGLKK